jgi:hypothetical protein
MNICSRHTGHKHTLTARYRTGLRRTTFLDDGFAIGWLKIKTIFRLED